MLSIAVIFAASCSHATDINVSGFGSVMVTDNPFESSYMEYSPGSGFDGSRFGVMASAKINNELTLSSQLLNKATSVGRGTHFRWAMLDYKFADKLHFRIGKLPLTSRSISDINFTSEWNNEPAEFFDQTPFRSMEGVELRYGTNVGGGRALSFELSHGSASADVNFSYIYPGLIAQAKADNLIVASGTLYSSDSKVRISYAQGDAVFSVSENMQIKMMLAEAEGFDFNEAYTSQGAKIKNYTATLEQEFGENIALKGGITLAESNHPSLTDQYGYYITVTKTFDAWQAHYTIGHQKEKIEDSWESTQYSQKVGLSFELNGSSNIRVEATHIDSKNKINDNFLSRPQPDKGVMTSVAYNFIF